MYSPYSTLGQYQNDALAFLQSRNRGALFLPMGTGKTFCIIEHLKYLARQGSQDWPCVVFTPKIVANGWVRELKKFGDGLSYIDVSHGPRTQRLARLQDAIVDGVMVVITNYEFAPVLDQELGNFFGMVICDESTRVKNVKAKRSRAVYRIAAAARIRYILTGSPITKGLEDIYGQMYVLDSGQRLGESQWKFYNRYFSPLTFGPGRRGWVPKSGSIEKVKSATRDIVFKRERSECLTLPAKRYTEISIDPTSEQKQVTKEIMDFWRINGREMYNALAVDTALRQVACGFMQGDQPMQIPTKKYQAISELIQDASDARVVVWTNFIMEQQLLYECLVEDDIHCSWIRGETHPNDRTLRLEGFLNGDIPVMLVSEQVGAYGLNELADADLIIYASNSYDLELRKQSEDRSYRASRTTSPVYYDFIIKNSIEEHILKLLKSKHQLSKEYMREAVMTQLEEFK